MEKEFPLLLSKKNAVNMRIIKKEKEIISVVNFLPRKILIEGTPISIGSIGAVCTHFDHRGKGYSTKILEDVENRMKEIGIKLCLISSTRNLYKKWKAEKVKNCKKYKICAGFPKLKFTVREYRKEDIFFIKKIYDSQKTRYLREKKDFETLIDSGTFPFGDTSYKRYVLEDQKIIIGYIILKNTLEQTEVKEAGGEKNKIFDTLAFLGTELGIKEINYIIPQGEIVPEGILEEEKYVSETLKIIDFKGLMEELKPYFRQYLKNIDLLKAEEENGKYKLSLGSERLEIECHKELLKLIFEKKIEGKNEYKKNINKGKLKEFIDTVFPLPFPWTENLNYQ